MDWRVSETATWLPWPRRHLALALRLHLEGKVTLRRFARFLQVNVEDAHVSLERWRQDLVAARGSRGLTPRRVRPLTLVVSRITLREIKFVLHPDGRREPIDLAPPLKRGILAVDEPHNGYTRSFAGLLEILDPVRFTLNRDPRPRLAGRQVEDVPQAREGSCPSTGATRR